MLSWQRGADAWNPEPNLLLQACPNGWPAMTKTSNHLFYIITGILTVLATIPEDVLVLVPAKYKPYVVAAGVIAMWIKGHLNLFTMPPGEPAAPAPKDAAK